MLLKMVDKSVWLSNWSLAEYTSGKMTANLAKINFKSENSNLVWGQWKQLSLKC